MIDLILIIIIIISLFKPDVLLSKKMKETANEEQKAILTKNYRKMYAIGVAFCESVSIIRYNSIIGFILAIIFAILVFGVSLPASKEIKKIRQELNL